MFKGACAAEEGIHIAIVHPTQKAVGGIVI